MSNDLSRIQRSNQRPWDQNLIQNSNGKTEKISNEYNNNWTDKKKLRDCKHTYRSSIQLSHGSKMWKTNDQTSYDHE